MDLVVMWSWQQDQGRGRPSDQNVVLGRAGAWSFDVLTAAGAGAGDGNLARLWSGLQQGLVFGRGSGQNMVRTAAGARSEAWIGGTVVLAAADVVLAAAGGLARSPGSLESRKNPQSR